MATVRHARADRDRRADRRRRAGRPVPGVRARPARDRGAGRRCAAARRRPVPRALPRQADLRHSGPADVHRAGADRAAAARRSSRSRPAFTSGQQVDRRRAARRRPLRRRHLDRYALFAKAIVVAGGVGSFQPRRLQAWRARRLRGTQVFYGTQQTWTHLRLRVVVVGGGDEAVDGGARTRVATSARPASPCCTGATSSGLGRARGTTCGAARRPERLNSSPARPAAWRQRKAALDRTGGRSTTDGARRLPARRCSGSLGLSPKLGPIAEWGLALERKQVVVDTATLRDQRAGHLRGRRHQHLPGQEEAHPLRLPRSARSPPSPPRASCWPERAEPLLSTRPPARSCTAARRRPKRSPKTSRNLAIIRPRTRFAPARIR